MMFASCAFCRIHPQKLVHWRTFLAQLSIPCCNQEQNLGNVKRAALWGSVFKTLILEQVGSFDRESHLCQSHSNKIVVISFGLLQIISVSSGLGDSIQVSVTTRDQVGPLVRSNSQQILSVRILNDCLYSIYYGFIKSYCVAACKSLDSLNTFISNKAFFFVMSMHSSGASYFGTIIYNLRFSILLHLKQKQRNNINRQGLSLLKQSNLNHSLSFLWTMNIMSVQNHHLSRPFLGPIVGKVLSLDKPEPFHI